MYLSNAMRDLLLLHLDSEFVPVIRNSGNDSHVLAALATRGFVRYVGQSARAEATQITPQGRDELAKLLGEYADILSDERCEKLHDIAVSNWRARRNSSAGGWLDRWTTPTSPTLSRPLHEKVGA